MIALVVILAIPVSNVSAGGPRLDSPINSTREGANCWVDRFDAGFAGKYDRELMNARTKKIMSIIQLGNMVVIMPDLGYVEGDMTYKFVCALYRRERNHLSRGFFEEQEQSYLSYLSFI